MLISKLDAARIQLDSAIDHYFQGNHVCALTLAGAAEEILGSLLKESGQQNAFEFLHDWYQQNQNETISGRDFSIEKLNRGRNWLKHANTDQDTKMDITEIDSIVMLMRALPCYQKLTNNRTPKMQCFFQHWSTNKLRIDELFS